MVHYPYKSSILFHYAESCSILRHIPQRVNQFRTSEQFFISLDTSYRRDKAGVEKSDEKKERQPWKPKTMAAL
jgi:hypothetical protein